jgi:tetratricopeptide (TPR) repeat protein
MVSCPVTNVPLSAVGLNQEIYQRLKLSMSLNLRRQIFIAVCDDLNLRDRLAANLQTEISPSGNSSEQSYPGLVSLQLSLDDPNPLMQIAQWLTQSPPPIVQGRRVAMPAFQILGVEHLTRQSPAVQRLFFTHLQTIERNLPLLDFSVLIWMTQPWFYAISHSAPEFWRCRTGVFEFAGDPTPLTVTSPERFEVQSSGNGTLGNGTLGNGTLGNGTSGNGSLSKSSSGLLSSMPSSSQALPNPALSHQSLSHQSLSKQPLTTASSTTATNGVTARQPNENANEPFDANEQLITEELVTEELVTGEQFIADDWSGSLSELLAEEFTLTDHAAISTTSSATSSTKTSSEAPINASSDVSSDVSSGAATDAFASNPWMLLEDEFEQLYEPCEPCEPLNHTPSSEVQLADEQGSKVHTVPAFAIELPDGLAEQPQLKLLLRQIELLHQQGVSPLVLVEAYRTFGNFFRDRIEQGEATPQHLVIAIQAYEQTLLLLPESSPTCVDVLNDLGNLYWMMSRMLPNQTETMACLQQAIQAYQQALARIHPANHAQTYPMVQNNLGAAYADLARHQEPVENLERSVQAYQQALRYRKPDTDPLRYASTQNNLGTTYWNLAQYKEPAANLKQAIAAYSDALRFYNPEQEPLNYAMIQNNLGTAYWNVAQHERPLDWLKLAVASYQAALQYRTLEAMPFAYAATQNNLGTAYWHIANQTKEPTERIESLQQAIGSYEAALQTTELLQQRQPNVPLMLNFDRFATHNNLGIAHYQLATESLSSLNSTEKSTHLQAALNHHVQAEQGWQGQANLRQTAMSCIIQTIRATYNQLGVSGQNVALSGVPGHLLPEILPKL